MTPEDQQALTGLVAGYAAAVDRRDWTALAALFTSDAVLVTPDPPRSLGPTTTSRGPEAIVATVRAVESFACTLHHLTGTVWSGGAGEASGRTSGRTSGRSTAVAHHVEDGAEPRSWVWHLEYADTCVRGEGGWRFARRELTLRMIELRPLVRVLPFGPTEVG